MIEEQRRLLQGQYEMPPVLRDLARKIFRSESQKLRDFQNVTDARKAKNRIEKKVLYPVKDI